MSDRGDTIARADREFHEATAHVYDDSLLPIFGVYYDVAVRPALDEMVRAAPGRDAVDVGCGTAGVTLELARRGMRVVGIDHSPAMLKLGDEKVAAEGLAAQVELVPGDVRALPVENGRFDALTCQGVLHHLASMDETVAEFARVLRPGGRFFISEPCYGSSLLLRAWDAGPRKLLARRPATGPAVEAIPHHEEYPIHVDELVGLLEANGLEPQVAYWTHFEEAHRLPPRIARGLVRWGSRPWRDRSGNLVYVTGRRR